MLSDSDWDIINRARGWRVGSIGTGILRVTLLFGSIAVALALIMTPILQRRTVVAQNAYPYGVDTVTTGSINNDGGYIVRRSVLQATPDAVCIIRANGTQSGDC